MYVRHLTPEQRAITGFEDNYADAPLTPAEYTEEQILYDL